MLHYLRHQEGEWFHREGSWSGEDGKFHQGGVGGLETGDLRWGSEGRSWCYAPGPWGDAQPGHHEEEVVGERSCLSCVDPEGHAPRPVGARVGISAKIPELNLPPLRPGWVGCTGGGFQGP